MRQLYYLKNLTLSSIWALVVFGFGSVYPSGTYITFANTNDNGAGSLVQVIGGAVNNSHLNDTVGFDLAGRPYEIHIQSSPEARFFPGGIS